MENVILKAAKKDKFVAEDFYSSTNYRTEICHDGRWIQVQNQRMDAMIVVQDGLAECKKLRDIKKGDLVVCGEEGVRTLNDSMKAKSEFEFMNNGVSSERRNELLIKKLAEDLGGRDKNVTVIVGPVVVHTGGDIYLRELIRKGYINSLLSGNAVAVHDIEKSYFGTSLGVCAKSGRVTEHGYKNHMRAINRIMGYGSIEEAVNGDGLKSGIMYECVKHNVPFVLAGSLRDDGPLPDTVTDMIEAQTMYNEQLKDADIAIVLGSMLHGIASGNMLPARTEMYCVDINPAVVTKLSDRGSSQAVGIVTDVGLFLNLLSRELESVEMAGGGFRAKENASKELESSAIA